MVPKEGRVRPRAPDRPAGPQTDQEPSRCPQVGCPVQYAPFSVATFMHSWAVAEKSTTSHREPCVNAGRDGPAGGRGGQEANGGETSALALQLFRRHSGQRDQAVRGAAWQSMKGLRYWRLSGP